MLLDGPAVKSPSSNGETALMRAAARGDVAEARRRLDECGGETPVAGLRLCTLRREVVEAILEYEKGMSDSQNLNVLLGSQKWTHRGRQDRHSPRGPN